MTRERLYLYDTTLRDGAQTNGVDFTLHDKRLIASLLDDLGIDYVEGGYPGANPLDTEFFSDKPKLSRASFAAFGMTRRPGRSASNDPGIAMLLDAKADAICFVAKSSEYQVRVALETTKEENIASIRDSVAAAKAKGCEVLVDCEHFFDGYKADPEFALACARAAYDSGARWVVLCDTNGGTMPDEVEKIVGEVVKHIPGHGRATVDSHEALPRVTASRAELERVDFLPFTQLPLQVREADRLSRPDQVGICNMVDFCQQLDQNHQTKRGSLLYRIADTSHH